MTQAEPNIELAAHAAERQADRFNRMAGESLAAGLNSLARWYAAEAQNSAREARALRVRAAEAKAGGKAGGQ